MTLAGSTERYGFRRTSRRTPWYASLGQRLRLLIGDQSRRFLATVLVLTLAGCTVADPVEMSCKATFLYAEDGPDAAVRAFEDFTDKRDYVVANNLASYLMLRGFKSGSKADFDQASNLLELMDVSQVTHPLVARYIDLLKFMASANGSTPDSFKLAGHCSPRISSVDCATLIASEVINQSAASNGSKSKVYLDFLALYSRTHLTVFGSEFQLQSDSLSRMFAQDESSCSTTGRDPPGAERVAVPQVDE